MALPAAAKTALQAKKTAAKAAATAAHANGQSTVEAAANREVQTADTMAQFHADSLS